MKKYFKDVKKYIVLYSIILLGSSLVSIFTPIINANLLTSLTKFDTTLAYKIAFLLLIVTTLNILFGKLSVSTFAKIKEHLLYNIRLDMLKRMFKLKTKNFDVTTSGQFQEKIKTDPESIAQVLSIVQYNIFNVITEVFILIYIFYINIYIGLIYLLGLVIIYIYEKIAYEKFEELDKQNLEQREKNGTILNEVLKGIRDIKLLNVTNKITNIASENLKKQTKLDTKISIARTDIYNTVDFMKAILTTAIIVFGIFLINKDILTLTNFLIIFMYRSEVFSLIFSYTSLKEYLIKYKVAKERINELYNTEKYEIEEFGTKNIKLLNGDIEFKNVTFAYKEKEVLHNLSFKIKANETIAIVGKSGSGKSTIFNLLTKNYDNYKGDIYLDNINIKELNYKTLRDNISIITQSPYLFNLTIKENLELIDRKVTKKEIEEACKIARIHDYIMSLPKGYDTLIGEGGVNLSGGQKQRLAIARALLKKSRIILFDEATSALDNVTQREIQKAIDEISKDYTIIIIAHRLSTVMNCDRIYTLDKGKIVDSGTHEELLERNKEYQKLYKTES